MFQIQGWDAGDNRLLSRTEREDQAFDVAHAFMERYAPVAAYSAFVTISELPHRRLVARWNSDANKKWKRGHIGGSK